MTVRLLKMYYAQDVPIEASTENCKKKTWKMVDSSPIFLYEVCSINTQAKILTEKLLMSSVMLLYRNKLEVIFSNSVYN